MFTNILGSLPENINPETFVTLRYQQVSITLSPQVALKQTAAARAASEAQRAKMRAVQADMARARAQAEVSGARPWAVCWEFHSGPTYECGCYRGGSLMEHNLADVSM